MVSHPFLIISLLVWLDLESDPNNMAPSPKRNPPAAEETPAEEPQVELSMYNVTIDTIYDVTIVATVHGTDL